MKYVYRKKTLIVELVPLLVEFHDAYVYFNKAEYEKADSAIIDFYIRKFEYFSKKFERIYDKFSL